MPLPSRRSTGCSTRTWTASSTWRPISSTLSRGPTTSSRASWPSSRSGLRPSRARSCGGQYDHPALLAGRKRRLALLALAAACLALLALAPAALGDSITPESGGSPNANDIDTLYKITLYIAIVIFLIVEGTLIWSIVRFRARRGGPEPDQIRGNTPLEVGWTVGAALILVVLTVVTFLYLDGIKNPPASGANGLRADAAQFASIDQPNPPKGAGKALNIHVNGQQYIWRFDYPGSQPLFSFYEMVV